MRGDWDGTLELNREQTGGYCVNRQEKDRMMCLHDIIIHCLVK